MADFVEKCPFCGSLPHINIKGDKSVFLQQWFFVECNNGDCVMGLRTKFQESATQAVSVWNNELKKLSK